MQATIDVRLANMAKMSEEKFQRMLEIVQEALSDEFPSAIVRVRKTSSMPDISVFGLGKEGKQKVAEYLEALFDEGSAFSELNEEYY